MYTAYNLYEYSTYYIVLSIRLVDYYLSKECVRTGDRAKCEVEQCLRERQASAASWVDEQLEGLLADGRHRPTERTTIAFHYWPSETHEGKVRERRLESAHTLLLCDASAHRTVHFVREEPLAANRNKPHHPGKRFWNLIKSITSRVIMFVFTSKRALNF